jgi:OHS family lactose permease-like MFS transporter
MNALGANQPQITAKTVFSLFRQRRMWMFILYVIGVACVYDVFDQQFATFFKTFFATPQEGTRAFGFATTAGEICNAIIMFCSPWIINRIGAKNTLLIAGVIMATRIIGSSFATTAVEVIALKMLHALEVPFLLVGPSSTSPGCLIRVFGDYLSDWLPVCQTVGGDFPLRVCREYV